MDALKGYRTLLINGLTIVVAALDAFPAEWTVDYVVGALALANFALRFLTTTRVGEPS